jgi:uncharacterized protein (DUF433 family)
VVANAVRPQAYQALTGDVVSKGAIGAGKTTIYVLTSLVAVLLMAMESGHLRTSRHNHVFGAKRSATLPLGRSYHPRTVLSNNGIMQEAITRDPEVMHGTPVFRGTRVPVQTLFDYIENGDSLDEFLEGFPTISRELAVQVLEECKELRLARV